MYGSGAEPAPVPAAALTMPGLRALPGLSASSPAFLLLLALLLARGSPAVPGTGQELQPGSRLAAAAARVALQYRNFQGGSPGGLRQLGHVRKATLKVSGERAGVRGALGKWR